MVSYESVVSYATYGIIITARYKPASLFRLSLSSDSNTNRRRTPKIITDVPGKFILNCAYYSHKGPSMFPPVQPRPG